MLDLTTFQIDPRDVKVSNIRRTLSSTDISEREVLYVAAALGISDALVKSDNLDEHMNVAMTVMIITDVLNEIVILDRPLFSAKLRNALEFRINAKESELKRDGGWVDFLDFLGVSAYFSTAEVAAINSKFQLFSEVYSNTKNVFYFSFEDHVG